MKVTFLVAFATSLLAFGSIALATPAVGDDAVYNLTWTTAGGAQSGTLELQLTAYDAASDSYNEHTIFTDQNGNSQASDQTVTSANLLNDSVLNNLATLCPQAGGTLGQTTVPAGTFQSCNLPVTGSGESGEIWLAAVPFGILQENVNSNGENVVLQLRAYTAGQK